MKPYAYAPHEWPERWQEAMPIMPDPFLTKRIAKSLAYKPVIASGETQDIMDYAMHRFPTTQTKEELEARYKFNLNMSSMQLSVLIANFGDFQRISRIEGKPDATAVPSRTGNRIRKPLFL